MYIRIILYETICIMELLIINSRGHWTNGWAVNSSSLETTINVLKKTGLEIQIIEVNSLEELENLLDTIPSSVLIWVNAYWVNMPDGSLDWLGTYVEQRKFPLVGQKQKTLEYLLRKDICQSKLRKAGIPVPNYIVYEKSKKPNLERLIKENNMKFPLVAKPTNESRSSGVKIVKDMEEANTYVEATLAKYPEGNIIMEEFIASTDMTCSYIPLGDQCMLLASQMLVEGLDGKNDIFDEKYYELEAFEKHIPIKDKAIINQLKIHMLSITDLFEIESFMRADARVDESGNVRFFDVNGMPGLNYPVSASILQCASHFPTYDTAYLFQCLINTLIFDKLLKYNLPVPSNIKEHNLFVLESETAVVLSEVYA